MMYVKSLFTFIVSAYMHTDNNQLPDALYIMYKI